MQCNIKSNLHLLMLTMKSCFKYVYTMNPDKIKLNTACIDKVVEDKPEYKVINSNNCNCDSCNCDSCNCNCNNCDISNNCNCDSCNNRDNCNISNNCDNNCDISNNCNCNCNNCNISNNCNCDSCNNRDNNCNNCNNCDNCDISNNCNFNISNNCDNCDNKRKKIYDKIYKILPGIIQYDENEIEIEIENKIDENEIENKIDEIIRKINPKYFEINELMGKSENIFEKKVSIVFYELDKSLNKIISIQDLKFKELIKEQRLIQCFIKHDVYCDLIKYYHSNAIETNATNAIETNAIETNAIETNATNAIESIESNETIESNESIKSIKSIKTIESNESIETIESIKTIESNESIKTIKSISIESIESISIESNYVEKQLKEYIEFTTEQNKIFIDYMLKQKKKYQDTLYLYKFECEYLIISHINNFVNFFKNQCYYYTNIIIHQNIFIKELSMDFFNEYNYIFHDQIVVLKKLISNQACIFKQLTLNQFNNFKVKRPNINIKKSNVNDINIKFEIDQINRIKSMLLGQIQRYFKLIDKQCHRISKFFNRNELSFNSEIKDIISNELNIFLISELKESSFLLDFFLNEYRIRFLFFF